MLRVLITGANRGIGLEFVRQYLARGEWVFAACRAPDGATALHQLGAQYRDRLQIVPLDVADEASIEASFALVSSHVTALDVLINNAGIGRATANWGESEAMGEMTFDGVLTMFRVNTLGAVMVTQRFRELLAAGTNPKVFNMSSWLGSISERTPSFDSNYGYAMSKAALDMFSRVAAFGLAKEGIHVAAISPGWLKTDMGGESAPNTVEEGVQGMIKVFDGLTAAQAGHFLDWRGHEIRW